MVQGTASSAGKSLLVAALCRIFRQDGLRVAPFKSQNMALNSFPTAEGHEIGRAQVVQAQAAGLEPHVDMNPILLKPEADARSQVVLMGKPWRSMTAREYYQQKPRLLKIVKASLARLRAAHDLVVIEGAGSPAEVNLQRGDIANMRVAELAQAPVLLVGDIDRGGVFAALVGTMELLTPEQRERVAGLVINKFRGDLALLRPGLDFLEERVERPVLGVIPYIRDLKIAEEDSVALDGRRAGGRSGQTLDIAIARLPRIANFDEFAPLEAEPDVVVRYVNNGPELGSPDLAVLPGSKSTIADLRFLRSSGLAEAVVACARRGTPILGICGGYQMLGRRILDPQLTESNEAEVEGLGLLPVECTFEPSKITDQVRAVARASKGLLAGFSGSVTGYEIHMGRTSADAGSAPLLVEERGGRAVSEADGCSDAKGYVIGTYLHGLFANDNLRWHVLDSLRARRGLSRAGVRVRFDPDAEYDRLAGIVREHLDMPRVRAIARV